MNYGIKEEVQTLFNALDGLLEGGELEGVTKSLPLYSNELTQDQIEQIRLELQEKLLLISRGAVPVVTVGSPQTEDQAGELLVQFLRRYDAETTSGGCFVDAQGEACWYFKVADEFSGKSLAKYLNHPESRRKLEMVRFNFPVEVSSLHLLLLGLRDKQVSVLKFGYKSTGELHLVDV